MEPSFVSPGQGITAQWANNVVSSVKAKEYNRGLTPYGSKRIFKPFDPISLTLEGSTWYLILNEAYRFNPPNEIAEILDPSGNALTSYTRLSVVPNKDLFYNWKTEKLEWLDYDAIGNLKILRFNYDVDTFTITNLHPQNIDLTSYPPFFPLLVNNAGSYEVALTPGKVLEINPAVTGGTCVNEHIPTGTEVLTWKSLSSGQQATIKTTSSVYGTLSTLSYIIEDVDPVSLHYIPTCGDDQVGRAGEHHYKMCYLTTEFINVLGGSHINYTLDVPYIDNVDIRPLSALSGCGRIIQEYIPYENKFAVRGIKQRDDNAQIHVEEVGSNILIKGNSLSGNLILKVNNEQVGYPLEWEDGLVTSTASGSAFGWDVTVPILSAGNNITINQTGNIYTISSSVSSIGLSGGSGWPEPAGTEGDMLYHNGITWVKFDGPAAPSSGYKNVLHHSGTVPSWTTYQELTASFCVAGTPAIYKILAIAV